MDTPPITPGSLNPILQRPMVPPPQKGHSPMRHLFITVLFAALTIGVALLLWSFEQSITKHASTTATGVETLYTSGNLPGAIAAAEGELSANPNSTAAMITLSFLYSQNAVTSGDMTFATKGSDLANKALLVDNQNPEAYRALGFAAEASGNFTEAIAEYNKGLTYSPQNALLISYLGHAFAALGRTVDAQFNFERALSINPNLEHAQLNVGKLYLGLGTDAAFTKGQTLLTNLSKNSKNTAVQNQAALFLHIGEGDKAYAAGDFASAEMHYQAALALNSGLVPVELGLAWAEYYQLKGISDPAAAVAKVNSILKQVNAVLTATPTNARAYYLAALLHVYLGKSDIAKSILDYDKTAVVPKDLTLNATEKTELLGQIASARAALK
jgi:tetratricopeptide (TPR) repeat protein